MSRQSDFHPGSDPKAHVQIAVRLSTEDRAKLVALSHARSLTASDVLRALIREAHLEAEA